MAIVIDTSALIPVIAGEPERHELGIRRKDGRTFSLVPEKKSSSPLDVPAINANVTTQEMVDIVREGRGR